MSEADRAPSGLRVRIAISLAALALLGCSRDGGNALVVYDAYEGGAAYPSKRPKLARSRGDLGLTCDVGSDTVSAIDFASGKVLASLPVGRDPIDIDGPHDIGVDDTNGFAYVVLSYPAPAIAPGPHAAHGSSVRPGYLQKLALDDLRIVGEVQLDPNAAELHIADDGSRVVVAHFDLRKALSGGTVDAMRANLAVVDPREVLPFGSPPPTMIPTCIAPHDLALSRPDGRLAYVACYGEDAIAVVDTTNPSAPVERVPVGAAPSPPGSPPAYGPYSIEMSPSAALLYVGDTESKDVRFFDTSARAMTSVVVPVGGLPGIASWSDDESTLYVAVKSPDQLLAIDPKTGAVRARRAFDAASCTNARGAVLGSDATRLYVICEGDHTTAGWILVVNRATFDTEARHAVGVYPNELEILEPR